MIDLSKYLDLIPSPMVIAYRDATVEIISAASEYRQRRNASREYENEVFQYLFDNKKGLGIEEVHRYENQKVDGALLLTNGKLVPIEIKYRMNWPKACEASWQITWYCSRNKGRSYSGGIVFFEKFSPDWDKIRKNESIEMGWVRWYLEHYDGGDLRFHLVRILNGEIETYPDMP